MEAINSRITALRRHLGLNQTKFAQKIGVTSQHVSMFEAGKANFSETTINLICLTFGVNEEWLREGKGEMMDDEALLSERERRLLGFFRRLSPKAQMMIIEYTEKLLSDEQTLRGEVPEDEKRRKTEERA
ncbi:MAG: helix-turn-helix domain-containing protein [Helicobacteraceae bacterium]|nr:helix-turn-helix domain-containing protein [Helicobacteraceae bacterium]